MSATYSTREQFTLQGTGDNLNTWGTVLNTGGLQLVDDAIAGYVTVDVSSVVVTLTRNQGSTDQDRMMGVQLNGVLTSNVDIVVASVSKLRAVRNNTSGSFTITVKTLGGTGAVVPQGTSALLLCDSASVTQATTPVSVNPATPAYVSANQTFTGLNTFEGGIKVSGEAYGPYVPLTDATSIAVDMSLGINFVVTLTGNRTLKAPTNIQPGQSGLIVVVQNVSGSKTLGFNSVWKFAGGTDPTMSTSAGAVDVIPYQSYTSSFILAGSGLSFS